MRITNKYGLPEAIRKACETGEHTKADYSVTQLLKPAQEVALSIVLDKVLEDDCIDRFWAIFGTAVHKVLEEQQAPRVINEVYLDTIIGKATVSGKADVVDFDNEKVVDYKTCSAWKFRLDDSDFSDWREQIKGYLYLLKAKNGFNYTKGEIVAILRDWSQTEAGRDSSYPQKPIQVVSFSYTEEEVMQVGETWEKKIADIEGMIEKIVRGEDIGFCPDEETWTTKTTYAVMKEGRKSAVRVFETREQAEAFAVEGGYDVNLIAERKGEHKKCANYCILAKNGYCRGCHAVD